MTNAISYSGMYADIVKFFSGGDVSLESEANCKGGIDVGSQGIGWRD